MDIKPVRRPMRPPVQPPRQPSAQPPVRPPLQPQPPVQPPARPIEAPTPPSKPRRKKLWLGIVLSVLAVILIAAGSIWAWYQHQLTPVDSSDDKKVSIVIVPASSPATIAAQLKDEGVIRDVTAFMWYARLNGVRDTLKAGSYQLSPSESTPQIVDHLVKGSVGTFTITFFPGATLVDKVSKPENRKDVTSVLENAGYSSEEIAAALSKTYDHPVFQDKPATADLEGYVFGETYQFNSGVSVDTILTRTFDELYRYVVQDNLVAAFKQQGLTLYEGITLASIIQRESGGDDKAQIAQVFYSRMAINMQLGSDVTYQYIADKTGIQRNTNIDSPYNTRRYVGLPPGPIAAPGLAALRAVAAPASGDYLYFLSGDDNQTYYGRTLDEHEANIANHCKTKCRII
jgi:UPF0755 protein